MRLSLTRKPHKKAVTQLIAQLGQSAALAKSSANNHWVQILTVVVPEHQPQPARQRDLISAGSSAMFTTQPSKNKGPDLVADGLSLLPRQGAPRS
jgi:hypothetical protein